LPNDLMENHIAAAIKNNSALAPLWIETLPPEEALEELKGRQGEVFRIQEVRFLADLGRMDEARQILEQLSSLPFGLAEIKAGLLAELSAAEQGATAVVEKSDAEAPAESAASKTLAELYASQGNAQEAISTYRALLADNPEDDSIRRRIAELSGKSVLSVEELLADWLANVRAWRQTLGV